MIVNEFIDFISDSDGAYNFDRCAAAATTASGRSAARMVSSLFFGQIIIANFSIGAAMLNRPEKKEQCENESK